MILQMIFGLFVMLSPIMILYSIGGEAAMFYILGMAAVIILDKMMLTGKKKVAKR